MATSEERLARLLGKPVPSKTEPEAAETPEKNPEILPELPSEFLGYIVTGFVAASPRRDALIDGRNFCISVFSNHDVMIREIIGNSSFYVSKETWESVRAEKPWIRGIETYFVHETTDSAPDIPQAEFVARAPRNYVDNSPGGNEGSPWNLDSD